MDSTTAAVPATFCAMSWMTVNVVTTRKDLPAGGCVPCAPAGENDARPPITAISATAVRPRIPSPVAFPSPGIAVSFSCQDSRKHLHLTTAGTGRQLRGRPTCERELGAIAPAYLRASMLPETEEHAENGVGAPVPHAHLRTIRNCEYEANVCVSSARTDRSVPEHRQPARPLTPAHALGHEQESLGGLLCRDIVPLVAARVACRLRSSKLSLGEG